MFRFTSFMGIVAVATLGMVGQMAASSASFADTLASERSAAVDEATPEELLSRVNVQGTVDSRSRARAAFAVCSIVLGCSG